MSRTVIIILICGRQKQTDFNFCKLEYSHRTLSFTKVGFRNGLRTEGRKMEEGIK
jgi:hypothetical protein